MLHLILGRSGSGKTHMILDRLAEEKGNAVLLVPEQYSFESERALLDRGIKNAEVLSFTRLCHQMLCLYGGIAGKRPGEGEKLLLMARAVRLCADRLVLYRKQIKNTDFYRHILSVLSELRYCGVTPAALERTALLLPMPLKQKIGEIALIAQTYTALLGEAYTDPDDDMDRLCELLKNHAYFTGKRVYVDAFKDFTGPQNEILKAILCQAEEVTVALCADGLEQAHEAERFAGTKSVAAKLIRTAGESGVGVAAPVLLTENKRTSVSSLAAAEELLAGRETDLADGNDAITVCRCDSRYEEADFAAAMIAKAVRDQGFRYRDITVIARDPSTYDGILDAALDRCKIPYFYDRARPVTDQPLMVCVTKALDMMADGLSAERLLCLCKTGVCGLSAIETAKLENYAFIWNLSGRSFTAPFTLNPQGATEDPIDEAELEELNALRQKLTAPLQAFLGACPGTASARVFATAIYDYLSAIHAQDQLKAMAEALEQQGDPFEAEDLYRSWGILMTALDQTVSAFGDTPLEKDDFRQLLRLLLTRSELNKIPQGIDQVTVGAADRTRPGSEKMIVIIGANQGEFPAIPASGGLLTDRDRAILKQNDIPLSDHGIEDTVKEEFLFYTAAASATQKLVFTYSASDGEQELHPCRPLISLIDGLSLSVYTPETYRKEVDPLLGAEAMIPAFDRLAKTLKSPDTVTGGLWNYFEKNDRDRLTMLNRLTDAPDLNLTPEHAQKLYGKRLRISPSEVETYHKCRFNHFCRYGLRVKVKRPVAFDVLATGTVAHYVLEHMLRRHGSRGLGTLSEAMLKSNVHALLWEYLEEAMGGKTEKSPLFLYQAGQIESLLITLVSHVAESFCHSKFETVACELPIRKCDGGVPPVELPLPNGGKLAVTGVVDRLDVYQEDGVTYVRVADYKTGTKALSLDNIYYGLDIQMLIYLFAVEENGGAFGENRSPAGVLYVPLKLSPIDGEGKTEQEILQTRKKNLCMNGIILNDPAVLNAMDPDRSGIYVPLKYNKNGGIGSLSSIADLAFFGNVKKRIMELLTDMGTELSAGHVDCDPLDTSEKDACAYCDFSAACPRLENTPHRKVPKLSNDQLKALKKGADFDGLYGETTSGD